MRTLRALSVNEFCRSCYEASFTDGYTSGKLRPEMQAKSPELYEARVNIPKLTLDVELYQNTDLCHEDLINMGVNKTRNEVFTSCKSKGTST